MRDMSDKEIMELAADDFRELTPQEAQLEIKQMLVANNQPASLV
jgi:hypothetical protein